MDILVALDTIETYLTTKTSEDVIRDGVKCQLIVIGEASRGLSVHARELAPEIPGREFSPSETSLYMNMRQWIPRPSPRSSPNISQRSPWRYGASWLS
jgi:hypothetical protein